MNKKALKSVFMSDTDVTGVLDQQEKMESMKALLGQGDFISSLKMIFGGKDGYTPVKGKDYFTAEEVESMKAEILKGATPEKFKDYFTEKEISYIMNAITSSLLKRFEAMKGEVTPVKGIDYKDGIDAFIDEEKLMASLLSRIPAAKERTIDEITKEVKANISVPTIESIVKEIKSKGLIPKADSKSKGMNMSDQRWHGGGPKLTLNGQPLSPVNNFSNVNFLAGSGVTITATDDVSNSRVNLTITASGGSAIYTQNVTGVQAGSNVTIDLTQLSNPYTSTLLFFRNGQSLMNSVQPSGSYYSVVGTTLTVFNASSTNSFLIQYN